MEFGENIFIHDDVYALLMIENRSAIKTQFHIYAKEYQPSGIPSPPAVKGDIFYLAKTFLKVHIMRLIFFCLFGKERNISIKFILLIHFVPAFLNFSSFTRILT